ncbi:hypothetical protein EQU24_04980 [Methylotuvimicrobium buryatense]|uniref:Uncharacterized protein n=1 Tax=Methylotuvimicrobium buryatense TaxID=95641 RepID=A0A4P9UN94_METBY|nr:hypothetical protein EQU24_04980 [Methylotuvimicrobium buryatense]
MFIACFIPFVLQISAALKEAPGTRQRLCQHGFWHRAYMDLCTASFDEHPDAELWSTMGIHFRIITYQPTESHRL